MVLSIQKYKEHDNTCLLAWFSDYGGGLETEGSRVRGLLEPENWPCVGAQVKDGSHVVIWAACKRTHNQYETSCRFRPHPR